MKMLLIVLGFMCGGGPDCPPPPPPPPPAPDVCASYPPRLYPNAHTMSRFEREECKAQVRADKRKGR